MNIAHLVDDDEAIRDALVWLLRSRGIEARAWPSAEAFLADYRDDMRGCLILDIRMLAMSGLELFERLKSQGCCMPTIFLTGHGGVPQAVRSIKDGAYDFIEKPFNDNELADRVIAAIEFDRQLRQQTASTASKESAPAVAVQPGTRSHGAHTRRQVQQSHRCRAEHRHANGGSTSGKNIREDERQVGRRVGSAACRKTIELTCPPTPIPERPASLADAEPDYQR